MDRPDEYPLVPACPIDDVESLAARGCRGSYSTVLSLVHLPLPRRQAPHQKSIEMRGQPKGASSPSATISATKCGEACFPAGLPHVRQIADQEISIPAFLPRIQYAHSYSPPWHIFPRPFRTSFSSPFPPPAGRP